MNKEEKKRQLLCIIYQFASDWGMGYMQPPAVEDLVNRILNAMPEESEGWLCHECAKKLDYVVEENQIAKRKIEEFIKAHHPAIADEYSPIFKVLDWLDQGGE